MPEITRVQKLHAKRKVTKLWSKEYEIKLTEDETGEDNFIKKKRGG